MLTFASAAPAISAAFLGSLVEAVEAVTIVLAVATVRGWRSAGSGALAGVGTLALLVLGLGPLLARVPLRALELAIGVLLLLFGLRWLRKAILRAAGTLPRRDERAVFERTTSALRGAADGSSARVDFIALLTCFKAVLLEGLEVVFIVLAVGTGHRLLVAASVGALAACALVVAVGLALQRPLARVPENTLKFAVGVLLSAFGLYWSGEGLGVAWPGGDRAILGIAALVLAAAIASVVALRRRVRHGGRSERRAARSPRDAAQDAGD
jgi:Ca2+/H+ antiporter, TMEM165/GDT1 family